MLAKLKHHPPAPAPSTGVDSRTEGLLRARRVRQYERNSAHREQFVVDDEQFPGLHERVHLLLKGLKNNGVRECVGIIGG